MHWGKKYLLRKNIGPILDPINSLQDLKQLNINESLKNTRTSFPNYKIDKEKEKRKSL